MKIIAAIIVGLFLAACDNIAPAQAQPCQWNYTFVNGVATANYCGNVNIQGQSGFGQNFLNNSNWQLNTVFGYGTAENVEGTGTQNPITVTGFTGSSNTVTFNTANTQEFYVGEIFYTGIAGFPNSGFRVSSMVPNVSVTATLPLGLLSPSTTTGTLIPIGQLGVGSGGAFDGGWNATSTLIFWADDFAANAAPGAIRTLGIRKAANTAEDYYWQSDATNLIRYKGRTITCGALVKQKVQTGSGTSRLYINDGVSASQFSSFSKGTTATSYEFLTLTANVAASATEFQFGIDTEGKTGDVYYMGIPTCYFGSTMTQSNLGQRPQEELLAVNHWNPPLLTPLAMTFPSSPIGTGLYGFDNQDIEAMSFGYIHKSVRSVKAKIEFTTSTAGAILLTGKAPLTNWTFGPEASTSVAGVISMGASWWPMYNGGLFNIVTNTSGLVITNATFDFDDVIISP